MSLEAIPDVQPVMFLARPVLPLNVFASYEMSFPHTKLLTEIVRANSFCRQ